MLDLDGIPIGGKFSSYPVLLLKILILINLKSTLFILIIQAVILAGGKGSRLGSLTKYALNQ